MKGDESAGPSDRLGRIRRIISIIAKSFRRLQRIYHCKITFANLVWEDLRKEPRKFLLLLEGLFEVLQDPPHLGRRLTKEYPADFVYTKSEYLIYYDYIEKPRTVNILLIGEATERDRLLQVENTIEGLLSWAIEFRLKLLEIGLYVLYGLVALTIFLFFILIPWLKK